MKVKIAMVAVTALTLGFALGHHTQTQPPPMDYVSAKENYDELAAKYNAFLTKQRESKRIESRTKCPAGYVADFSMVTIEDGAIAVNCYPEGL